MLIDLHCHSRPLSQCSALRPEEVVDLARERGLDGVCFTEHDAHWDLDELEDLRRRTDFAVFAGIELTTDLGHALGYGLDPAGKRLHMAEGAAEAARTGGGALFLAHPARDGLLKVDARTLACFDGVEAHNGSDSRLKNVAASGLAKGFRLPGIGGSDAHTFAECGSAATEFEARIETTAELVAALKSGAYGGVRLRD